MDNDDYSKNYSNESMDCDNKENNRQYRPLKLASQGTGDGKINV